MTLRKANSEPRQESKTNTTNVARVEDEKAVPSAATSSPLKAVPYRGQAASSWSFNAGLNHGASQAVSTNCTYHAPLLKDIAQIRSIKDVDPITRFNMERPSEQHALFTRPDNGKLSTSKNCSCDTSWDLVGDLTGLAMDALNDTYYDDVGIPKNAALRL